MASEEEEAVGEALVYRVPEEAISEKSAIDIWTLAHFGAGCIAGTAKVKKKQWLMMMVGWEFFEQSDFAPPEWHEPLPNIMVDIIVGYIGWMLFK